jgi:hypothetical protein
VTTLVEEVHPPTEDVAFDPNDKTIECRWRELLA